MPRNGAAALEGSGVCPICVSACAKTHQGYLLLDSLPHAGFAHPLDISCNRRRERRDRESCCAPGAGTAYTLRAVGLPEEGLIPAAVGAQWELRGALPLTDQRLNQYDAFERAHVDGRSPPGDRPFRLVFEPGPAASASDGKIGLSRGNLLIWRRLERNGSPVVFRPRGPGSL